MEEGEPIIPLPTSGTDAAKYWRRQIIKAFDLEEDEEEAEE
jgi:hypothetical protein